MDKLDQNINEAKDTHEPSPEFVPTTMHKVEAVGTPKKRRFGWKVWAPLGGGAVVVAGIIAFILVPRMNSTTANTTTGAATSNTSAQTPSSIQTTTGTPIDPTNTSDAALNSDLSSIKASLNQSSSDQSAADSSINDNQQQISVPTN